MLNKRNDDTQQQMPLLPDPGDTTLKYVKAVGGVFAIALAIIAVLGHFDWVKANGLWILLAVAIIGCVLWQYPRALKHLGDHLDRNAKREQEKELNEAQVAHLNAKTMRLTETLPFDDQGNLYVRGLGYVPGQMRTFTQLTHYHNAPRMTGIREEKPEPIALPKPVIPTGRELLLNGTVERALSEGKLLLGPQDDGHMEYLAMKHCFSTLVSGLPATGKTTTVFWIAGQLVIIGARLWVVDPHLNFQDEEGNRSLAAALAALSDSFVFEPCDDDQDQVIQRLRWTYKELLRRKQPGHIVRARDTIIGIMDEYNTVAESIDPSLAVVKHEGRVLNFGQTLALLEREGRKFGLHFALIGHKWARQDIGGENAVRTNASTYLCHRLNDERQANLLLSGQSKKILDLAVGEYIITGVSWNRPAAKITTPLISAHDLPLILQIKQRGIAVQNPGNVIEGSVALPDLPKKQVFPGSSPSSLHGDGKTAGRHQEDALEAAGRENGTNSSFELKKFLNEAGKMRANGESIDGILKQYGLAPGGRNNQNLRDLLDGTTGMEIGMEEDEELEED